MKKRILWLLVSCLMVLSLVLASCAPAVVEEEEEVAPPVEEEEVTPPVEEEEEVIPEVGPQGDFSFAASTGYLGCRVGLDPCTAYVEEIIPWGNLLFEGLVRKDETGAYMPSLAKSWEIGPNWEYIDYTLQEGVKFHNGEAFTAEDVKFTLERYMREDLMWLNRDLIGGGLDRVEIVDDYHVRVYCKEPLPTLLHFFWFIVPKDYIEEVGDEEFAYNPVGTGPCKFTSFMTEQRIDLEAVDNHWRQTPDFKFYHQVIAEDEATRLAMLKTGELDMCMLSGMQIPDVEENPDLRVIWIMDTYARDLELFDVAYDDYTGPWRDPKVRKAAMLALDREGYEKITHGTLTPGACLLPPYCLGYDPSIKPDPYDPERARELLTEAGYPDGFDTVLVSSGWGKESMEFVQTYWNEVGIKTKLEVVDDGAWATRLVSCEERGVVMVTTEPWWVGATHPCTAMCDLVGVWFGAPTPDFLREAYNKALWATTDEEIAEAGREMERLVREFGIWLPVWKVNIALGVGPRVESYVPTPGITFPFRFEYLKLKRE